MSESDEEFLRRMKGTKGDLKGRPTQADAERLRRIETEKRLASITKKASKKAKK